MEVHDGKRICSEWKVEGECYRAGMVSRTGTDLHEVVAKWEALYKEGEVYRAEETVPCPYGSDPPPFERNERDDYTTWRTGIVVKG